MARKPGLFPARRTAPGKPVGLLQVFGGRAEALDHGQPAALHLAQHGIRRHRDQRVLLALPDVERKRYFEQVLDGPALDWLETDDPADLVIGHDCASVRSANNLSS